MHRGRSRPIAADRGRSWQSWGTSEWPEHEWRSGYWREEAWQPTRNDNPAIPTPGRFKLATCHSESTWSHRHGNRAKGIAGMDIKQITLPQLCRHGPGEFGLRPLSNGKFTGVVLTRTIAESVLLCQIPKQLRDLNGTATAQRTNGTGNMGKHHLTRSMRPPSASSPSWTPSPRPSSQS